MDSARAIRFLKGVIATMALVCVIALAVHPVTAMGLTLVGMLFIPVLLWHLDPIVSAALLAPLEQRKVRATPVLVSRFQRPPPSLL